MQRFLVQPDTTIIGTPTRLSPIAAIFDSALDALLYYDNIYIIIIRNVRVRAQ